MSGLHLKEEALLHPTVAIAVDTTFQGLCCKRQLNHSFGEVPLDLVPRCMHSVNKSSSTHTTVRKALEGLKEEQPR